MVINKTLKTQTLRRHHRAMVLKLVATGAETRPEISKLTGLSSMGVTRIVTELIDCGLVLAAGKLEGRDGPGRHSTRLKINPDGAFVIGITISAFDNELVCVDGEGVLRARLNLAFADISDAENVIATVKLAVDEVLEDCGIARDKVLGIGAAIAGIVDQANGTVTRASYLGWQDVAFSEKLSRATGLPVVVENLANALNLSEVRFGAAKDHQNVLLVSGGTTCGSSYVHAGQPLRGATFEAGQIGHSRVEDGELVCSCGRCDCLNTVASGWSVLVRAGRIGDRKFKGTMTNEYAKELIALLHEGQSDGLRSLFGQAGRRLAQAAGEACLHLNPDLVLVAGAMTTSTDFIAGYRDEWAMLRLNEIGTTPELIFDAAPPAGFTAHLALDAFFFSPDLDLARFSKAAALRNHG